MRWVHNHVKYKFNNQVLTLLSRIRSFKFNVCVEKCTEKKTDDIRTDDQSKLLETAWPGTHGKFRFASF